MVRIVLVPTSHIASQSVKKVKDVIEKENPDCVAVELDMNRLMSFNKKQGTNMQAIRALGPTTFLVFWVMKKLQEWLGKQVGILPGSDMVTAVKVARQKEIKVALIDQNIAMTFNSIQKIPFREKAKLLWFLLRGVTLGWLLSKLGKGKEIDLSKLPPAEVIEQAMELLRKEFPYLHKALVVDRNKYMVKNIKHLATKFKRIVVVIGAGHHKGIEKLLSK